MTAFQYAEGVFLSSVSKHKMLPLMRGGCVLGFSGGADSVLLLSLLARLAERESFPLLALHVNHGIRGEEALRDESFCRAFAQEHGVAFAVRRVDVPAIADESGEGIEEAARHARYEALADACRANGCACILTAHHATDSAETVLLHLSRGSGLVGLCGIPAVRRGDDLSVLRPLLGLTRAEVEQAAADASLPFVIDSSNADVYYRRNYIRSEVLPRMRTVNPSFEKTMLRFCENAASDEDYLSSAAKAHFEAMEKDGAVSRHELLVLHPAMRYRVLLALYRKAFPDAAFPERVHTDAFFERLEKQGSFCLSFPDAITACVSTDWVKFEKKQEKDTFFHPLTPIGMGENTLADGARIILEKASAAPSLNVYKLSIHRNLSSATISGGMYVRSKKDGDSYRFGGVTHKLKKLFSDAKIAPEHRAHVPVLCDANGILWIPSFGVRDDGGTEKDLVLYYIPPEGSTAF